MIDMKRLAIVFLIMSFVLVNDATAQFIGTSTNYSGSRGRAINPSLMTTSYVYADFGLNLDVLTYNNLVYLHASDYQNFMKKNFVTSNYNLNGTNHDVGFDINGKPKNLHEAFDFNIISAMYNPDGKTAWGFFINNRAYVNGSRFPYEIIEQNILGVEDGYFDGRHFNWKNVRFDMMAWSEIGASWSTVLFDRSEDKIDVGVTGKGLIGYTGIAINVNEADMDFINKDTATIHKLDALAVMSGPFNFAEKFDDGEVFDPTKFVNGIGAGFDIGVTYTSKSDNRMNSKVDRPCAANRISYNWRLGLSLLDVGAIRFSNNTRKYKLNFNEDKLFDAKVFDSIVSIDGIMDTLCGLFYNNPSEAYNGKNYFMGLPTAASIQFDYCISDNVYVNATWIQPIKMFRYSSQRAAMLIVEPRYESQYFDFTLPVTLYNYERIFLGAEMRVAFLTVGTHNIFNLLGIGDSYGLDAYVALKFNLYKGQCFGSRRDECWNANFR